MSSSSDHDTKTDVASSLDEKGALHPAEESGDPTRRLEFVETDRPVRTRNANLNILRTITDEIQAIPRKRNPALALYPTKSVRSIGDGLQRVESGKSHNPARVPAEFRTMSIHVYDSQYHDKISKPSGKQESDSDFFARVDFHTAPVEAIFQRFSVSPKLGLEDSAIARLADRHGKNVLVQRKPNYFKKAFGWFFGGFCSILWVGAIVFFICWKPLGNPNPQIYNLALGCVLVGVVLTQGLFTAFQDWSTQRVMSSILSLLPENASVLRNGQHVTISPADLVPGDIVVLTSGNKVPADMRIIEASSDVRFDRSVLTGETEEVKGTTEDNEPNFLESKAIAFLGSHITNGKATGVVVLTGGQTVMGRINKLTNGAKPKTTLIQREVNRFVFIIIALTLSLIVIMAIFWGAYLHRKKPDYLNVPSFLSDLVGLIVAFTPEGMPMCVALTLSLIAGRMKKANVLPKALTTVETLGCVNVICSDKTGTLTENRMTVVSVGFVDRTFTSEEVQSITSSADKGSHDQKEMLTAFGKQLGICNDAIFEHQVFASEKPTLEELKSRPANGNATDVAILRFSDSLESVEAVRRENPRVAFVAFNSRTKWMMTAISAGEGQYDVIFKGAPDVLFPACTTYAAGPGGHQEELDAAAQGRIAATQEAWARQGQRVLMLAYKRMALTEEFLDTPAHDDILARDALNEGLCLVGLVGITDPPRPEIPQTVSECRRAGARFMMVTGDFKLTAAAIAQKCGILSSTVAPFEVSTMAKAQHDAEDGPWLKGGLVLQGSDIDQLSDQDWDTVCRFEEIVFARTTPEQKLRIVNHFQKRDSIVAVTGDGVNDAAALKSADVGIALAGGSDVAIESADLVLMGSFSAILTGIQKGRLVFQNLQKVISYLLPAGSYSEDWPVILNVFLGVPLPLSSFLMVIICCFTDLACCLSLIMEEEEFDLLSLPPRDGKKDHLINMRIYGQAYLFIGTIETICAHAMFFLYMYRRAGIPLHRLFLAYDKFTDGFYGYTQDELNGFVSTGQCIYFVTLVVMQWFNLLTVRNRKLSIFQANPLTNGKHGRRNWYLFPAMLTSLLIAIFVTEVGGMNKVFGTARVPIEYWFIPLGLGLGLLLMDELRKLAVRQWPQGFIARVSW